jgi:hypothetical protein
MNNMKNRCCKIAPSKFSSNTTKNWRGLIIVYNSLTKMRNKLLMIIKYLTSCKNNHQEIAKLISGSPQGPHFNCLTFKCSKILMKLWKNLRPSHLMKLQFQLINVSIISGKFKSWKLEINGTAPIASNTNRRTNN